VGEVAVVLEDEVGAGAAAGVVELRGEAGAHLGLGEAVAGHHAGDPDRLGGGDQDHGLDLLVEAGLEEQRDLVDDEVVAGRLEHRQDVLEAVADPRVEDRLEALPLGRVLEDDRAELAAVELAGVVEHAVAERGDDGVEALAARRDDDPRQLVGRNDRDPVVLEELGGRGLPAADPAGEAVDVHARKRVGPAAHFV
jgi:hypothetical protein